MEDNNDTTILSNRALAKLLSKSLGKKVIIEDQKKKSKEEKLQQLIKQILNIPSPKNKSRFANEEPSIEDKVSSKDLEESQLHMVESTPFWQEHQKKHQGAKLTIFNPGTRHSSETIRSALGSSDLDYTSTQNQIEKGVSYGPEQSSAPVHNAEALSYMGANDPSRPGFWATCECGMTMEVEGGGASSSPIIKSYGVATTGASMASIYSGTNSFGASYSSPSTQKISY
jgi:hypothetical protein